MAAKKKKAATAAASDPVLVVTGHCGVWVSGMAETVVRPGQYVVRPDPVGWDDMDHAARLAAVTKLAPGCVFQYVADRVVVKGRGKVQAV